VEKRKPDYDLTTIQATFCEADALRLTRTAQKCAEGLGMSRADIVLCIQGIVRPHFYKSMTCDADSRIWQDVYHTPFQAILLYVKFTTDADGYLLISFKER
jgi:motility quorum-sensing regulator / GCU-specific mRNA interferase toxin